MSNPGRLIPLIALGLLAVGLPAPAGAQQATVSTLKITVQAATSDQGKVCVSLFASKDGWPSAAGKAAKRACVVPKGGSAVFSFDGLAPGTYAAFAFHDEDANGQLKKNVIGMPKEGVGASNNAGGIGGPSFKAASFVVTEPQTAISFTLKYL